MQFSGKLVLTQPDCGLLEFSVRESYMGVENSVVTLLKTHCSMYFASRRASCLSFRWSYVAMLWAHFPWQVSRFLVGKTACPSIGSTQTHQTSIFIDRPLESVNESTNVGLLFRFSFTSPTVLYSIGFPTAPLIRIVIPPPACSFARSEERPLDLSTSDNWRLSRATVVPVPLS